MSLQVLRIDRQNVLEFPDRFRVLLLQKQNATGIVANDAIFGYCAMTSRKCESASSYRPFGPKNSRIKEMCARQLWRQRQRFLERGSRAIEIAFLNECPSDIDEAIGIFRIGFRRARKCGDGAFQVSLKKETDSVIVPSSPVRWIHVSSHGRFGPPHPLSATRCSRPA